MKIVHSFTTKFYNKDLIIKNICYYILSAIYVKKNGFDIVLHTDNLGAYLLNNTIYDNVYTTLEIEKYPKKTFAWAKFKAMENEINAIHIDGDVLFRGVESQNIFKFDDCDVIIQHEERLCAETQKYWDNSTISFSKCNYPSFMERKCDAMYNCGVIGFKDPQLYKEYSKEYFKLIEQLELYSIDINSVPDLIAEQYLLYCFCKYKKLKVKEVLNSDDIFESSHEIEYQHLWGSSKYDIHNINKCKSLIKRYRPDLYQHIKYLETLNF